MWSRNAFTERLGLDWPIVQAPMAGATTPALAAAVANAGGLGSLGCAVLPSDALRQQVQDARQLTARSINVNFFCHVEPKSDVAGAGEAMRAALRPYFAARGLGEVPRPSAPFPTFGEAQLAVLLGLKPQVVSFHFGLPGADVVEAIKATGALVVSSATTVEEARWLEANGADAVIAQGIEAGGHRGTFLGTDPSRQAGTMALVPQVVDAVGVPVIAAGGIADGRGIAAALMLGASAVQLGTAFLRCPEATVHPAHRAALATARDDGTRETRLFSGRPARVLSNRLTDELEHAERDVAPFPAQFALTMPLRGDPSAHDITEVMPMWSGQVASLGRELPAAQLVRLLAEETEAALRRVR